jgi:transposase
LHWLAQQKFDHPAQQIVFQNAVDTIDDAATRLRRLDEQVAAIVPSRSMAPGSKPIRRCAASPLWWQ